MSETIADQDRWSKMSVLLAGTVILLGFLAIFTIQGRHDQAASNAYWVNCLADWGDATSFVSAKRTDASEARDKAQGAKDRAMRTLVDFRGEPNTAITDAAKRAYGLADDAAVQAEKDLQTTRDLYPSPQLSDYCKRLRDQAPPKAQGQ